MEPPKELNNNEKPRFFCPDCNREFGNMGALTTHLKIHREPDSQIIDLPDFPKDDLEYLEDPAGALRAAIERAKPPKPVVVKVKKLPHGQHLPKLQYATPGSAAVDLYAAIDEPMCIGVHERANPPIPTGIAVEIPVGYYGKIAPRSGLGNNHGVTFINSPGIIDSDYRGEIKVGLINHSRSKYWVNPGDRIAQMIITKVEPVQFEYVEELSETERGEGGFGSTGSSQEIKGTPVTVKPGRTVNFADIQEEPDGKTVRKLPPTHDLRRNEV